MVTDTGASGRFAARLALACLVMAAGAGAAGLALRAVRSAAGGTLEVATSPSGAEIRVDGRFAGISPVAVSGLAPGEHQIEAQSAGHRPGASRAAVDAGGRRRVEIALEPRPAGSVEVASHPPGAEVTLDGRVRGPTPLTISGLPVGTHRLTLQRSRFAPWSAEVHVTAGATARVEARLEDTARTFLEAAAAQEPADMTPWGELFAYLVAVRDLEAAAECLVSAAGRRPVAEMRNADALGQHYFKQLAALPPEQVPELIGHLGARAAALGAADPAAAGRALDYILGVGTRGGRERPERVGQAYDVVLAAGRKAPGCLPILDRALAVALRRGEGRTAAELLAAGAAARPGDAEHAGRVALTALNRAKVQSSDGEARSRLLAAASTTVEQALTGDGPAADRVLRARLRRLHGRILLACGSAEQALAEQERALADLAPVRTEQAVLFWPWRVERARLLVEMKRVDDARVELDEIANRSPEGPWREEARTELGRLPAPEPAPAPGG